MFDKGATWIIIKLLEAMAIMGSISVLIMLVFISYTASSFFIEIVKKDLKERKKHNKSP